MAERLSRPGRPIPPWEPWEAIPVALAAFGATAIASVLIAAAVGIGGPGLLLGGLAFELALGGFSVVWVAVRHRGAVPALGLRSRRPTGDVVLGAFVGAAIFGVIAFVVFPAIQLLWQAITGHPPSPIDQLPVEFDLLNTVLSAVLVVAAAPFGEETFFRGFLYGGLKKRIGLGWAAIVSSGFFAAVHAPQGGALVPAMFVVGMLLALLYEWRGSLAASMAGHAAFNIIGFTAIVLSRA
ncbi:MAG: lysostaphin resistance A-like protein [Actinomycetota bacterium]